MEELNNIDWSYSIKDGKDFISDDIYKESAMFRMVHNNFHDPLESSSEDQESQRTPIRKQKNLTNNKSGKLPLNSITKRLKTKKKLNRRKTSLDNFDHPDRQRDYIKQVTNDDSEIAKNKTDDVNLFVLDTTVVDSCHVDTNLLTVSDRRHESATESKMTLEEHTLKVNEGSVESYKVMDCDSLLHREMLENKVLQNQTLLKSGSSSPDKINSSNQVDLLAIKDSESVMKIDDVADDDQFENQVVKENHLTFMGKLKLDSVNNKKEKSNDSRFKNVNVSGNKTFCLNSEDESQPLSCSDGRQPLVYDDLFAFEIEQCPRTTFSEGHFIKKQKRRNKLYVPGLRNELPSYPMKSSLTLLEHQACVRVLRGLNTNCATMPPMCFDRSDFELYNNLKPKIEQEQKLVAELLRDNWTTRICGRQMELLAPHKQLLQDVWRLRLARPLRYPQHYQLAALLPLVYPHQENPIQAMPMENLQSVGSVPRLSPIKLPLQLPVTRKQCENIYSDILKESVINTKKNVSEDAECERLAVQRRAQVVISSSGLRNLADNQPPYARSWDLPITVKKYTLTEANGKVVTHNVAYVDRALPPRRLTSRQQASWCYKMLLRAAVVNNNMPQNMQISEQSDYCVDCINYAKVSNNKENNKVVEKEESYKKPRVRKENEEDNENCSDSDGNDGKLIIDDPELMPGKYESTLETRGVTTRRMTQKINESVQSISEVTGNIKKSPNQKRVSPMKTARPDDSCHCTCGAKVRAKAHTEDVTKTVIKILSSIGNIHSNGPKSEESNKTYRLWKIGQGHQESQLSKTAEKDISFLVRCKVDASEPKNNDGVQDLMLAHKVEYQPEFGGECITPSEAARHWTALKFRPQSNLLRVRILYYNGEVMMSENMSMQTLTMEAASRMNWHPRTALGCIFNIFSSMSRLLPGSYLLRHEPKLHAFAGIYKCVPNSCDNGIDLYSDYQVNPCEVLAEETAPWVPLDPSLVTPLLDHHQVMPCMFAPSKRQFIPNKNSHLVTKSVKKVPHKMNEKSFHKKFNGKKITNKSATKNKSTGKKK